MMIICKIPIIFLGITLSTTIIQEQLNLDSDPILQINKSFYRGISINQCINNKTIDLEMALELINLRKHLYLDKYSKFISSSLINFASDIGLVEYIAYWCINMKLNNIPEFDKFASDFYIVVVTLIYNITRNDYLEIKKRNLNDLIDDSKILLINFFSFLKSEAVKKNINVNKKNNYNIENCDRNICDIENNFNLNTCDIANKFNLNTCDRKTDNENISCDNKNITFDNNNITCNNNFLGCENFTSFIEIFKANNIICSSSDFYYISLKSKNLMMKYCGLTFDMPELDSSDDFPSNFY